MNTLDLVKKDKVMSAIVIKSEESGFDIIEATSNKVIVKAGCLPVSISWEMCSCHGGRMWLSQFNTNINIELSSTEYDEKNGIVDPETELAFYIDNKMIDTINRFEKYVYVVDVIGEYKKDEVRTSYFKSIEDASYFVFHENGHDLNSEYGEVTHQYPNPNMQERITYIGEDKSVLKFKGEAINKGNVSREYEIKFRVFRKKN
nr:MAG TPA: hypothetical protein [Caudoviricetes sp.]